jgi:hypothetical protein
MSSYKNLERFRNMLDRFLVKECKTADKTMAQATPPKFSLLLAFNKVGTITMLTLKQVKSNTVLMMAMAMPVAALAPMLTPSAAMANGVFGNTRLAQTQPALFNQMRIAAGAVLPLSTEKNEKITLTPTETKRFTLIIPQNLRSRNGTLLVAAGSKVEGEFRPVSNGNQNVTQNGTQFVAQTLITTDGKRYAVDGVSPVITRREKVRKGVSTGSILKGAGAGAGAAAILGAITGDKKITVGEVITGAAVGAAGGAVIGRNEVEVIAIYPSQDLSLRLNQALALNY